MDDKIFTLVSHAPALTKDKTHPSPRKMVDLALQQYCTNGGMFHESFHSVTGEERGFKPSLGVADVSQYILTGKSVSWMTHFFPVFSLSALL